MPNAEQIQLQHMITAINEIGLQINEFQKEINLLKYEIDKTKQLNWMMNKKSKEIDDKLLEIDAKIGE
jgi:hypothetical protein